MTDEVWLEQVRQAIEKIAMNKPEARIVVMVEGKTPEQVRHIVSCAKENGLAVVVERLSVSKDLSELISADSLLNELPPIDIEPLKKQLEVNFQKTRDADHGRYSQYERQQMKYRMQHHGFLKKYRK